MLQHIRSGTQDRLILPEDRNTTIVIYSFHTLHLVTVLMFTSGSCSMGSASRAPNWPGLFGSSRNPHCKDRFPRAPEANARSAPGLHPGHVAFPLGPSPQCRHGIRRSALVGGTLLLIARTQPPGLQAPPSRLPAQTTLLAAVQERQIDGPVLTCHFDSWRKPDLPDDSVSCHSSSFHPSTESPSVTMQGEYPPDRFGLRWSRGNQTGGCIVIRLRAKKVRAGFLSI